MKTQIEKISRSLSRPDYESYQFGLALVVGTYYLLNAGVLAAPVLSKAIGVVFLMVALTKFQPVINRSAMKTQWLGLEAILLDFRKFRKKMRPELLFLGQGFTWNQQQRQGLYEISKIPWDSMCKTIFIRHQVIPFFISNFLKYHMNIFKIYQAFKDHCYKKLSGAGGTFLQSLGKPEDVYLTCDQALGHTLIVGTTKCGKTVLMTQLAMQRILMNDVLFVLDPKADEKHGLENALRQACHEAGRDDAFHVIDLAHPERSTRVDLMANYKKPMDLASRICATIQTTGDGEAFVKYGQAAIAIVCWALDYLGLRPCFKSIYHYLLNRQDLAIKTFTQYINTKYSDEAQSFLDSITNVKPAGQLQQLIDFCKARETLPPEFDAVVRLISDPDEHFAKMIPAVLEQLEPMALGVLGDLFSPSLDSAKDANKVFWNTSMFVDRGCVVYVSLDALGDASVAQLVGTMFISDLASTTSNRLNYDNKGSNICLFVDEAAEVVSKPFVDLLNKGRAAGCSITLATQTINDFIAKMRNRADAMRMLGNLNVQIALRCLDPETQQFISDRAGKSSLQQKQEQQGITMTGDNLLATSGTTGERFTESETELLPPYILAALPDFEYFILRPRLVTKGRFPIITFKEKP